MIDVGKIATPSLYAALFLATLLIPGPVLLGQGADDEQVRFFEQRIRPVLIEQCQECHSATTQASGGLRLDSRGGWSLGGDSGPAITPGDVEGSLLWQAISYEDPDLQMPPTGRLPPEVLRDFEKWIRAHAADPRDDPQDDPPGDAADRDLVQGPLPPAEAQRHWAYRPLQRSRVPSLEVGEQNPIDTLIDRKLEQQGLGRLEIADPRALWRRLHYDLTGLPPSSVDDLPPASDSPDFQRRYHQQVEQLLTEPAFGETFARHWMDVVRYADSVTLRGFILPNAWRYRDYLIDSFNVDKPFSQMILEQVAGDLLPSPSVDELNEEATLHRYRRQLAATTFLTLGNTNLETQDKRLLELDYIDEQLDVIGQAFLAQTISCARCHDHKFDPIPTRDYYALAGILDNSIGMIHDNVSTWVETPLPLGPHEAAARKTWVSNIAQVENELKELKARLAPNPQQQRNVRVANLPGVVVDDDQAQLVGHWVVSQHTAPYLESGYRHDENKGQGEKTATFQPQDLEPGRYEVRISYSTGSNRATNALVDVFSADGQASLRVNQRQRPNVDGMWHSLGTFRFEADGQAYLMFSNQEADGHVIIDGVQFLPLVDSALTDPDPNATAAGRASSGNQAGQQVDTETELRQAISQLEERRRQWQRQLDDLPKFMTVNRKSSVSELPILIRGDHKRAGATVPRGFLSASGFPTDYTVPPDSNGRLELARWIAAPDNPLTARVYANRVWSWLMGQGLVSSMNNFGTTGGEPTHPELLDWLAGELIDSGWSTKHLVRLIVSSQAYQRRVATNASEIDPDNRFYGAGHRRRLTVEALRDTMLLLSGELDRQPGGPSIQPGTATDYNYNHQSLRRSIYQSVFRNSLPALYREFDFADPSRPVGRRSRSTIPTQALALWNSEWVTQRAAATAELLRKRCADQDSGSNRHQTLVQLTYQHCLQRPASQEERQLAAEYLNAWDESEQDPLVDLVQSLFASLEFRFLE